MGGAVNGIGTEYRFYSDSDGSVKQYKTWIPKSEKEVKGIYEKTIDGKLYSRKTIKDGNKEKVVFVCYDDEKEMDELGNNGNLSTEEKLTCAAKGIWEPIKEIGTNPKKLAITAGVTVAAVAACFIPVVGPWIGGGLLAWGLGSGAYDVYKGVKKANAAKTDKDAREAYKQIGSGSFGAILSAIGLKGLRSVATARAASLEAARTTAKTTALMRTAGKTAEDAAKIAAQDIKGTINVSARTTATTQRTYGILDTGAYVKDKAAGFFRGFDPVKARTRVAVAKTIKSSSDNVSIVAARGHGAVLETSRTFDTAKSAFDTALAHGKVATAIREFKYMKLQAKTLSGDVAENAVKAIAEAEKQIKPFLGLSNDFKLHTMPYVVGADTASRSTQTYEKEEIYTVKD